MKSLSTLQERLEALPTRREGIKHEACYAEFLKKAALATESLKRSRDGATNSTVALPGINNNEVLKGIKTSVRIAIRLKTKLIEEPAAIIEKTTDESFTRLFDHASTIRNRCQETWESQLQAKIKDWQAIALVVAKLGSGSEGAKLKASASKLKSAIDSLTVAASNPPQTEQAALKVRSHIHDLTESISNLGLDSPFGRFLQDAASSSGADLESASLEQVAKQIVELKLTKVFRVHLSS